MTLYRAHGLNFASEIGLPFDAIDGSAEPDVVVELGAVRQVPDDAFEVAALCKATPTQCWVNVPGIARYEVIDGGRVVVQPVVGADPCAVAAFLTSSVLGAVLHQRRGTDPNADALVLEAAIVSCEGKAIALLSSTGDGQSSLAASLAWSGLGFLGDGLAHVQVADGQSHVWVGSNEARLWPDTLRHHHLDPQQSPVVHGQILKRRVRLRVSGDGPDVPMPLIGCIVVAATGTDRVEATELTGGQRFTAISNHTWRRRLITAGGYRNEHFRTVASLAATIPLARIVRPRSGEHFEGCRQAASAFIDDWRSS